MGPLALSVFMLLGQGADALSTDRTLSACQGCTEFNPLMSNSAVRWSAKALLVGGASVACFKLWPKHRSGAVALALIIGSSGLALALHNSRVR